MNHVQQIFGKELDEKDELCHVLLLASVQWLVVHGVGFAEGEGVVYFPLRLKQIGTHPC